MGKKENEINHLIQLDNLNNYDPNDYLEKLSDHKVLILKSSLTDSTCQQIITELISWRKNTPELNEQDVNEGRVLNGHLPLRSKGNTQKKSLDFQGKNIAIQAHNYRIGNINNPKLKEHLPTLFQKRKILFDLF